MKWIVTQTYKVTVTVEVDAPTKDEAIRMAEKDTFDAVQSDAVQEKCGPRSKWRARRVPFSGKAKSQ